MWRFLNIYSMKHWGNVSDYLLDQVKVTVSWFCSDWRPFHRPSWLLCWLMRDVHVDVTIYRRFLIRRYGISTNQNPTIYRNLYREYGPWFTGPSPLKHIRIKKTHRSSSDITCPRDVPLRLRRLFRRLNFVPWCLPRLLESLSWFLQFLCGVSRFSPQWSSSSPYSSRASTIWRQVISLRLTQ